MQKKRTPPRSSAEDRAPNSQHPPASRQHGADIAALRPEFEGDVPVSQAARAEVVIAGSAATKQSRSNEAQAARDCFASLAMTQEWTARLRLAGGRDGRGPPRVQSAGRAARIARARAASSAICAFSAS